MYKTNGLWQQSTYKNIFGGIKKMKEGNQKTHAINRKTYLYIALGVAALLLAIVVIIASVARAHRGNSQLKKPPEIISPDDGTQDSNGDGNDPNGNNQQWVGIRTSFLRR